MIRPNLRWTSDGFEIACWNGQSVRVAFALDTCDREVMSWIATTGGISGEMVANPPRSIRGVTAARSVMARDRASHHRKSPDAAPRAVNDDSAIKNNTPTD
jgi:transposase InsO family protein